MATANTDRPQGSSSLEGAGNQEIGGTNEVSNSSLQIRAETSGVKRDRSRFEKSEYSSCFKLQNRSTKDGKDEVKCLIVDEEGKECGEILKLQASTYNNLKLHLDRKHKILDVKNAAKKAKTWHQPTLFNAFVKSKYPRNHAKQLRFDEDVILMFALDGSPFETVDKIGFRRCVQHLDSKINIKSRQAYMKKMLVHVNDVIIPKLQKSLANIPNRVCHFSCDVWSTRKMEGVFSVLVHFIDDCWEMRQQVLLFEAIKERHTGENLRRYFLKCLADNKVSSDWGGCVITDNGSNMVKCFNLDELTRSPAWKVYFPDTGSDVVMDNEDVLQFDEDEDGADRIDEDEDDTLQEDELSDEVLSDFVNSLKFSNPELPISSHLRCAAHTLQLAINDGLKSDPQALEIIAYVNKVMNFFKNSTTWRDELRKKTSIEPGLNIKTRWNSTLDMLNKFQKEEFFGAIRDVLERVALEPRSSRQREPPLPPTFHQKRSAGELAAILKSLGEATDKLQADGPTANLLLLYVLRAIKDLSAVCSENFAELRQSMTASLKQRAQDHFNKPEYVAAAFLDPRIKTTVFELTWEVDLQPIVLPTKDEVILGIRRLVQQEIPSDNSKGNANSTDEHDAGADQGRDVSEKEGGVFGLLQGVVQVRPVPRDEVDLYLQEAISPSATLPLEYWRVNQCRFPILSSLARKYLAIPATSAGVERLFSIAGAIARARRSSISTENIARLLMVKWDFLFNK